MTRPSPRTVAAAILVLEVYASSDEVLFLRVAAALGVSRTAKELAFQAWIHTRLRHGTVVDDALEAAARLREGLLPDSPAWCARGAR